MTHDQAAALIEAAALVPGRLRALVSAETADGEALRAHLAGCAECRGELDAWQAVDEALVAVTPDTVGAPPAARGRILATVLATGVARSPDRVLGTASAAPQGVAGAAGAAPPAVPPQAAAPQGPAPQVVASAAPPVAAAAAAAASAPGAPNEGRVWRSPSGRPMPSPTATQPGATPTALGVSTEPVHADAAAAAAAVAHEAPAGDPAERRRGLRVLKGGGDRDGVGFRVFLAVAAAAVFLFVLGAALGGPLGLTPSTTVVQPDTTARVELEKSLGRLSDLLELPGAQVAALTDQAGEPAGAVVIAAPDTNLLGVVTRALPAPTGDQKYVCLVIRGDQRYEVGYMKFANDPSAEGDVAYWVGPLSEEVPVDVGAPGDVFSIYVDGQTAGDPILTATF
ncbi:MAG: zf-HC2 domain-containing protein [Chloroflexota bacterium]